MARAERVGGASRRFSAAVALVALVSGPGLACAQASDPVALEWNAPPGCSGARDVLGRVQKLTQSARLPVRQLNAVATITRSQRGRLHLTLALRAGDLVAERNIDGRTCEDLAGATAVVLALLLHSAEPLRDGELAGREPRGSEDFPRPTSQSSSTGSDRRAASTASASTASASTASASTAPASATESTTVGASDDDKAPPEPAGLDSAGDRSQRRWRAVVQLPLVSMGIGPLPRPSLGFFVAGGFLFERWSLLAEAGAWLKQVLEAPDQPGAGATVQRIEAAVRGCWAIPLGRLELAPCLRVSLQHLWTRGTGAHVAARTAEATWVAAGPGLLARYQLRPWFRIFVGIDAQVQTARPRISIDDVGRLGQLGAAALTITAGSEWIP